MQSHNGVARWTPLVLLLIGSVVFIAGGTFHPHADDSMGVLGSTEFFLHFAQTIVSTPSWIPMHVLILAGPVCWALAAPSVRALLPERGQSVWATAQTALTMSATLWIVGFVLDGFIAPVYANAVVGPSGSGADPMLLTMFGANQTTLVRIGLMSWILNGLAITLFSIGLLVSSRRPSAGAAVGVVGIIIGVWPFIAALTGEFSPGPFTSHFWKPTALVTAFWYVALGGCLMVARHPATRLGSA